MHIAETNGTVDAWLVPAFACHKYSIEEKTMRIKKLTSATMTVALALSAATWLSSAEAQQSQPQSKARQPPQQQMDTSERMLEDQIYVQLAESAWVGSDFKAAVNQGVVTLSGTVPSEQTKQKILRITRRTVGVTELRDQLRVDPSVGAQRSATAPVADAELSKRVAQKIANTITGAKAGEDWWFTGWRVEGPDRHWSMTIAADNGAVALEGEVPSNSLVRKAVEAALQVQGVRSVRSEIEIEPVFARYHPYYYPYGYPAYGYPGHYRYGYPYAYGAYGTARDDFKGLHTMTGEVTQIDKQKGALTLRTDRGTFDLHFPRAFLQDVKQGEKITVELRFKDAEGMAASPRTDSSATQDASGTKK